ncbi:MAG: hypothetical protein J7L23_02030 [Candidatus Diapherotrites archaeon]|nr:hypothetical protein [Candidatus Diapherotrites archaeon]
MPPLWKLLCMVILFSLLSPQVLAQEETLTVNIPVVRNLILDHEETGNPVYGKFNFELNIPQRSKIKKVDAVYWCESGSGDWRNRDIELKVSDGRCAYLNDLDSNKQTKEIYTRCISNFKPGVNSFTLIDSNYYNRFRCESFNLDLNVTYVRPLSKIVQPSAVSSGRYLKVKLILKNLVDKDLTGFEIKDEYNPEFTLYPLIFVNDINEKIPYTTETAGRIDISYNTLKDKGITTLEPDNTLTLTYLLQAPNKSEPMSYDFSAAEATYSLVGSSESELETSNEPVVVVDPRIDSGTDSVLKVTTRDKDDKGVLKGLTVKIFDMLTHVQLGKITTDENGEASIRLPEGTVMLELSGDGYPPQNFTNLGAGYVIIEGQETKAEVFLEKPSAQASKVIDEVKGTKDDLENMFTIITKHGMSLPKTHSLMSKAKNDYDSAVGYLNSKEYVKALTVALKAKEEYSKAQETMNDELSELFTEKIDNAEKGANKLREKITEKENKGENVTQLRQKLNEINEYITEAKHLVSSRDWEDAITKLKNAETLIDETNQESGFNLSLIVIIVVGLVIIIALVLIVALVGFLLLRKRSNS